MKSTLILAAMIAATLSATTASAAFFPNTGTGVEGTEEGTVRVDENGDPVVETTRGRGNGKGKNR